MNVTEARERVAKGAALLDRERPGWFTVINTGQFDMQTSCLCVIGQVCGNFYLDVHRFTGERCAQREYPKAEALGFWVACSSSDGTLNKFDAIADDYRFLQDAWIEAIADRLVTGGAKESETVQVQEAPSLVQNTVADGQIQIV